MKGREGRGDGGRKESCTITSFRPGWSQRVTWNLNNFLVGAEESSLCQLAPP